MGARGRAEAGGGEVMCGAERKRREGGKAGRAGRRRGSAAEGGNYGHRKGYCTARELDAQEANVLHNI